MDYLATDDKLTIVNRSNEYRINKKLICKIPYFEKLLSHNLKESKENKVILDFDEKAFKGLLIWLEFSHLAINMDSVITLCSIADYFGVENDLIHECTDYFYGWFSIEHLPAIIPQVTATSKIINSGTLNVFIRRHFLKIANATAWLDYSFETIEYICKLDLMIYSEYQVFDAIRKWVDFKADSRKIHIERLLKLVKWCHLEDKDLQKIKENELFKSSNFESELCSLNKLEHDQTANRMKQSYFIAIYELNDSTLRIVVLDNNFIPAITKVIKSNEQMDLNFLHDEHVSDIFFDSGHRGVRIDWKHNEYRFRDFEECKSHLIKICIIHGEQRRQKRTFSLKQFDNVNGSLLLEANGELIFFRFISGYQSFNCTVYQSVELAANALLISQGFETKKNFLATILDNNIYILTEDPKLFQINIDNGQTNHIDLQRMQEMRGWKRGDLLLASNQANDDIVILVDKSTKDVFCFNIRTGKCTSMYRLANCNRQTTQGQKETDKLLTFTSAFLAIDCIRLE